MKNVVSILACKLSDFCEKKALKERESTALASKFNEMAKSLLTQMHNRLGIEDFQNVVSELKGKDDTFLLKFNVHTNNNKKNFFFQKDEFFDSGPISPIVKVSSLKDESSTAVWKFVRRLYYFSCEFVEANPLKTLPFFDVIESFMPDNFRLFKFFKEICDVAAQDPEKAIGILLDFLKTMVSKSGLNSKQFEIISSSYLKSSELDTHTQQTISPLLKQISSKMFSN